MFSKTLGSPVVVLSEPLISAWVLWGFVDKALGETDRSAETHQKPFEFLSFML